ncbi:MULTISPECIES: DNA polymerase IV [Corallincola]|uniref:DNA polymerase IV n=2 Tax=Corallincola TaxID=1775176 RepID=A0ABY1WSK9_9GAMM|nr:MULTISPECIES: DNA polymerase IV [Corallincola]TAA47563.1 DNA polymerase IV [Corallincola spongiicola]TCI05245.1 DNA polymerase IV [Corallincola luteus]
MAKSTPQRKIIHIDMDCFYAAVEMRDNPQWRDKPIAVGGQSDRRGVIATCNYSARRFGVRSAMATATALRQCPNLILVKPRFDAYKSVSRQIQSIFQRYTNLIEPLSLDEAYLDVTHCQAHHGSATLIAEAIRTEIVNETGLTASAGVAPNKFIAKIASDENKPNGICIVPPDGVEAFVAALPLRKIPGVGPVTEQRLADMGLRTTADCREKSVDEIVQLVGRFGEALWQRSFGIDNRPVDGTHVRRSVGVETTLSKDISTFQQCQEVAANLLPELLQRLDKHDPKRQIHKQGVKLKFDDFQQTTVEQTTSQVRQSLYLDLLKKAYARAEGRGIRLVGLNIGLPEVKEGAKQLQFEW